MSRPEAEMVSVPVIQVDIQVPRVGATFLNGWLKDKGHIVLHSMSVDTSKSYRDVTKDIDDLYEAFHRGALAPRAVKDAEGCIALLAAKRTRASGRPRPLLGRHQPITTMPFLPRERPHRDPPARARTRGLASVARCAAPRGGCADRDRRRPRSPHTQQGKFETETGIADRDRARVSCLRPGGAAALRRCRRHPLPAYCPNGHGQSADKPEAQPIVGGVCAPDRFEHSISAARQDWSTGTCVSETRREQPERPRHAGEELNLGAPEIRCSIRRPEIGDSRRPAAGSDSRATLFIESSSSACGPPAEGTRIFGSACGPTGFAPRAARAGAQVAPSRPVTRYHYCLSCGCNV